MDETFQVLQTSRILLILVLSAQFETDTHISTPDKPTSLHQKSQPSLRIFLKFKLIPHMFLLFRIHILVIMVKCTEYSERVVCILIY